MSRFETFADVLGPLGDIDPSRIRLRPLPGQATEKDVLTYRQRTDRLYELVDGTLVEKTMGFTESALACDLIVLLGTFLSRNDLGFLVGADGAIRLLPGLVRIPDVSFISWQRLGKQRQIPSDPLPEVVPDLAVEVLSTGNTAREMQRKLKEYFLAGVRLVWLIDPRQRQVRTYTAPDREQTLGENDTLQGGEVLPGLAIPLTQLFARLPPRKRSPRKRS
jgi:Uma2 family endonuclease